MDAGREPSTRQMEIFRTYKLSFDAWRILRETRDYLSVLNKHSGAQIRIYKI